MKCDRCGLQSDVEQAFSTEKRLLRRPRHFCPDCTGKRYVRIFIAEIGLLVAAGILLFAINPSSSTAIFYLEISLFLILMAPLIVMHELAHALVAGLVGLRIFGIVMGMGRPVWQGKFLGMDWVINILPISGVTMVGARPVPHIRSKLFLIHLAGPAAHILVALVCQFALQTVLLPVWAFHFLRVLVYANVMLAAVNLFPRKVAMTTGMQGSDGWQLLRTPFMTQSELTRQYVGCLAGEAMQAYAANDLSAAKMWVEKALALDADSGVARNILGIIRMAQREYQAARETFVGLLDSEAGKEPGLHYLLLNNIAYLNALLRDPALLPEADQFSAEALQHLPWVPAVTGTRGTVLVELGRLEEGIALLKRSMALHAEKQGKALNACHIAFGEMRRGDLNAARAHLAIARTLDRQCFLLPEVEAQLKAASPVLLDPAGWQSVS